MAFTCQAHSVIEQSRIPIAFLVSPTSLAQPCMPLGQPQSCQRILTGKHAFQAFGLGPQRSSILRPRLRSCQVRASSGGDSPQESPQTAMSPQEAYNLLGVGEDTKFEQIMSVKNKLVSKAGNDAGRKSQVHS